MRRGDRPIEDYALIGDMRSCALVASDGGIDWLCWPRFDSPALLLHLLDSERGGACTLEPTRPAFVRRHYVPDTNVLETLFETDEGVLSVMDFMPVHWLPAGTPEEGPDSQAEGRLVRRLRCVRGRVGVTLRVRPAFDYARRPASPPTSSNEDHTVCFGTGEHTLRLDASHPFTLEEAPQGPTVSLRVELREGERAWLGLAHELEGPALDDRRVELLLDGTRTYWETWSRGVSYQGRWRNPVLRGILCLKLLTYAPTGAIVAAATTSLPESLEGNRNFDYRFTWMRDASFTISAFLNTGHVHEAAEFLRFLKKTANPEGDELRLLYGIHGPVLPEEELGHLSGWRGRGPVRIGNAATEQRQYDIYGEFLASLHLYLAKVGGVPPTDFGASVGETVVKLAEHAIQYWHAPDNGIWELRGKPQHILHTKAMLWVALHRAIPTAQLVGVPPGADLERWARVAGEIRAEYLHHGWNAERGYYAQAYGSHVLDAAVMRVALYDGIAPEDPRLHATLDAIERELAEGELVYRYREADDGFQGEEGAFFACGFWLAGCRALMGQTRRAVELFDRLLLRAGPLGLFAEEIDPGTGGHLGNYPQAFTHMALINNALRIERCIERFGVR